MVTGCSRKQVNTYQGYIEGKFVYVASPQSGRLDHLSVTRGETIEAGHPLFQFDNEPEADEVRQAEHVLRTSQSRLADLQKGKRPAEVDVTRAQLMQALAEKKQADQILASDQAQYRAGGIPQTELINAQAAAETSTAKVRELEASLGSGCASRARAADQGAAESGCCRSRLAGGCTVETATETDRFATARPGIRHALSRRANGLRRGIPWSSSCRRRTWRFASLCRKRSWADCGWDKAFAWTVTDAPPTLRATITFISPQNEYTPPVIYSNENRSKLVFMVIAKPTVQSAPMLHPGQPVEVTLPMTATASPEYAIDVQGLNKHFGDKHVVKDVSLRVRRGEIFGFLGPNGSGKTTTIRMMCGLLKPDSGSRNLPGIRHSPRERGDQAQRRLHDAAVLLLGGPHHRGKSGFCRADVSRFAIAKGTQCGNPWKTWG